MDDRLETLDGLKRRLKDICDFWGEAETLWPIEIKHEVKCVLEATHNLCWTMANETPE